MQSQALSRARLTRPNLIDAMIQWLCVHGVLGSYHDPQLTTLPSTEDDLLEIVPLIYGLTPAEAWQRPRRVGQPALRPLITAHLERMGIPTRDLLIDVLVAICDQYRSTDRNQNIFSHVKKFRMRDVRAQRGIYALLQKRQSGRCATCGDLLSDIKETLDHIVPWRLGGDPLDGSNWQILCELCNGGKSHFISILQDAIALNWLYGKEITVGGPMAPAARYMALRQNRKCQVDNCQADAESARLIVAMQDPAGLHLMHNLQVLCDRHFLLPRRTKSTAS